MGYHAGRSASRDGGAPNHVEGHVWRRSGRSWAAAIGSWSCSARAAWRPSSGRVDTQLGREVAVKLLRPEYLRDPDFSSRFRQEAQNAASLSHPNVVTVYDYGEDPSGPFIVMEFVDGEDLADDPAPQRLPAADPGGADRRGRRPRPGRRPCPRHRPSRREAGQRAHRPRRSGQGRRLRDRASDRRGADDAARHDARVGPLLQPGAGPRRDRDERVRHLRARHRPVRDAHRQPAMGGRQRRRRRAGPADRPGPGSGARRGRRSRRISPRSPARRSPACPADRFASAAAMADALEATAARTATVGRRRCRGRGRRGGRAAGVARSNPTVVAYPPDAYAGAGDDRSPAARQRRRPVRSADDEDEPARARSSGSPGSSPIVLLAAHRVPRLPAAVRPADAGPADRGRGPELRRHAPRRRDARGGRARPRSSTRRPQPSDQPVGTITAQDPLAGHDRSSPVDEVSVTVAAGLATRCRCRTCATRPRPRRSRRSSTAGLRPGHQDRGVRPDRAVGLVVTQSPAPGVVVAKGSAGRLRHLEGTGADADPDAHPDPDAHADPDARPRRRHRRPRPTPTPDADTDAGRRRRPSPP